VEKKLFLSSVQLTAKVLGSLEGRLFGHKVDLVFKLLPEHQVTTDL